jgi:hypothetical protein
MTRGRMLGVFTLAVGVMFVASLPAIAADNSIGYPIGSQPIAFAAGRVPPGPPPVRYGLHLANPVHQIPKPTYAPVADRAQQDSPPFSAEFNLNYHVLGVGNGFPGYSVPDAPPDPNLAVGDTEIVERVNVEWAIFNKSNGAIIQGPQGNFTEDNYIFHVLLPGSLCDTGVQSDPIIKWDRVAHRWVMAQNVFTSPYAVCVAISQTPHIEDNLWFVYEYSVPGNGFPDYPKWGVWSSGGVSDGYYQGYNDFGPGGGGFQGGVFCGYDRAKMLAGNPSAEQICFHLSGNEDTPMPADRDSPVGPPVPEDEFFIGSLADVDNSHLSLYSMHINNWATHDATMTGLNNSQLLAVQTYTGSCNGQFGGACVPQLGVSDRLDTLGNTEMYRFAYWDDRPPVTVPIVAPIPPPLQHWFINWSVESTTGQIGVRWMELIANQHVVPVTALTVFQQGTYAGSPADSKYRWMASIARDNVQDILLGYSLGSSSIHPAIAVAGRKFGDPLGQLSAETIVVNGTGSQPDTGSRWGDYTSMAIDPSDNCTFVYVNEYYMVTQNFDWSTDVSTWKFPNCQ